MYRHQFKNFILLPKLLAFTRFYEVHRSRLIELFKLKQVYPKFLGSFVCHDDKYEMQYNLWTLSSIYQSIAPWILYFIKLTVSLNISNFHNTLSAEASLQTSFISWVITWYKFFSATKHNLLWVPSLKIESRLICSLFDCQKF